MKPSQLPTTILNLLFSIVVVVFAIASKAADSNEPLQAGAYAADISPEEWPLNLRGTFNARPVEVSHDPLHARTLVLGDGATLMSITVVDSLMISRENFDKAKAIASEKTEIPTNRMLIAATHTHTAPASYVQRGTEPEIAYEKRLIEGIADSIVQAAKNMQTAEVAWGSSDLPDEVFNRRWFMKPGKMPKNPAGDLDQVKMHPPRVPENLVKAAGPVDPEVSILSVRDTRGRPLCLLGNYSLHYVGGVPSGEVSADYFGRFASLVENRLSKGNPLDGFVGIMSNGTSGDVNNINYLNPRPPREPFEQINIVAGKTADAAWQAYQELTESYSNSVPLGMIEREISLKLRHPSPERVERAKEILSMSESAQKLLPRLSKDYAVRTLKQAEAGDNISIKIQAIRIGELAIVTFPFEVFAETGLDLKARSPFADTFVIELANGADGYLPTPRQHKWGGYETWLPTNRVQIDTSDIITDNLLEMLDELKAE